MENLGTSKMPWLSIFGLLIVGYVAFLMLEDFLHTKKYRYPNLVPGLPIVGNMLQMPATDHGPYLQKLAEKYGEMFTLKLGRSYWVILNSRRTAHELLEKRAAIYSSRMSLPTAHNIVSGQKRMVLMPYNERWRAQRKLMHQVLNVKQSIFRPLQDLESKALMYQLLEDPQKWYLSLARYSSSVILSVVFGIRTKMNDPVFKTIFKAQEEFVPYTMPGHAKVDSLPFLTEIPYFKSLQPWRWKADKIYQDTLSGFTTILDELEARIKAGTQKECFMTELRKDEESQFTRDEITFIAVTLLEAGSDTTRITMVSAIAAAAMYPDWVRRAREQLDEVCGKNAERLPTFEDMERLPYIQAVAKEATRWRPSNTQTGLPHALIKDDEFEGYRFPAGTVVTWNHWGISNDQKEYDDPMRFRPERFLDDDLSNPRKGHLGFGAGRRQCVGYNLAATNQFIVFSRLLYCFDIQEDVANPLVVDKPFPLTALAEPYKVFFKPRSEAHRQLIERECKAAASIDTS
ncbi:hypothetical protein AU210_012539 [Fusarium oxysporum f. sp. radicis-cucumerinum]|uniref:Cytochrome P450 n=3 Tax=Fusarium oxysporum TaxID=5507 RepID=A0A2H3G5W3_FUSOX|nr:hypothetical protein AU210_012539 [Fusarium oxysporum f. sp. radicis-cucumerinum]RKK10291.1 hypothetical protein BFJ65_g15589 [Fusarium oxysporum f. sp. cepae]RKK81745.1 hypothetical protein BFJ71_g15496 [Fusarium oxysporum]RKK26801.1 hypothetical protein BFJ67_g16462 [Fusarium oxysporum f. sp. cepae]RKK35974.1 hypothetical protein BFJ66_g13718 [Fusarium oxysporum f. sp. cepae]